jgi:hypothetical protein
MSVSAALFRIYRPIILIFTGLIVLAELIAVTVVVQFRDLNFSMWLVLAGNATKYWLLVVGIMLVGMQLRQFVSNGVTRHEFVAGAAVFLVVLAAGFTVAVALGHGLESVLVGAAGRRGPDYPVVGAGEMLKDVGRVLPSALAWPTSGALIALGFYRFHPLIGLVVMVLGSVPAMVTEGLLRVDEFGRTDGLLPYAPALLISVAATTVAAVAFRRLMSDVPIRRTTV